MTDTIDVESAVNANIHRNVKKPFSASSPDAAIYLDSDGSDTEGTGTILSPYKTLTKALSVVSTSQRVIKILTPGNYAEAASLTWPNVNNIHIIGADGAGDTVISGPASTPVITINPTFTSTTFEAFLENVCVEHTVQVGIEIDNTNMTRKLLVHLVGVSTSQVSTGDSIHVTHTTAGQAIRVYASGCDEIEGLVNCVCANADDRFRFRNCTLIGGLTVAGAVAGEVSLLGSVVLTSALTTDGANVVTTVGSCYRTDAGVYTELANAFSA